MSVPAIEVTGLTKQFKHTLALDNISFEVPAGCVFGFLGPNGAGKTTAIRILLGLGSPDAGRASILGVDCLAHPDRSNRLVGFLPDVPAFYPWMKAREYLTLAASLFGMKGVESRRRVDLLLDMAHLGGVNTPIGGFSRGMKQRLGLAQALVNSPKLLIMDEPTSALDPMGRHELLDLVTKLKGNTTVFFSTHILSDVEKICDRVAVLAKGSVVAADSVAGLRAQYGSSHRIRIELHDRDVDLAARLQTESWALRAWRDESAWLVEVSDDDAAGHRLPHVAADHGWGIRRIEPVEATLEDAFMHLIRGEQQGTSDQVTHAMGHHLAQEETR